MSSITIAGVVAGYGGKVLGYELRYGSTVLGNGGLFPTKAAASAARRQLEDYISTEET